MGNLAQNPEFQQMAIEGAKLAQARNLSRYGHRDSIEPYQQGKWFALRCQGHAERLAAAGLIGRGFKAYLPIVWVKERSRRGSVREVERPMFSTYLFLYCLPRADHFQRVRNVAGVQQFVGEGMPESVPEPAIDAVRRAEAELATKAGRKTLRWKMDIGDSVVVVDGPFTYFRAKITSAVDDKGRIEALVDIFGRHCRTLFDADQLEKA